MVAWIQEMRHPSAHVLSPGGDRSARARLAIVLLAIMLTVTALWSLASGAADASAGRVIAHWLGLSGEVELSARDRLIIEQIRLPRVISGILIGACLAVSGAVMQGLFRNPLADPGIVGVSAGAALGAVTAIVLGTTLMGLAGLPNSAAALPIAAFVGGLVTTWLLYRVATRGGQTSVATMLLAGIALGAFALAATGLLIFIADDAQIRELTFWSLGSLAGSSWSKILFAGPVMLASLAVSLMLGGALNGLALGEAAARHLGIPVQRMKYAAIVTVAGATGASVAISGGIGFVGIVVPHLLRLLIGPDHRYLLPASALLGAVFLLVADVFSRTIVAPAELPIGILTAAIGAPFFLWILLRRRGIVDM